MSATKHVVRSRYNYDPAKNSADSAITFELPSLTVQDALNDTDINEIVRRYGVTGKIPVLPVPPQFGDFTGVDSFHEAMNIIAVTNETFDAQPADIREKFANDPQKMLDFLNDESNIDEAVKLGLVKAKVESSTEAIASTETKPSQGEA